MIEAPASLSSFGNNTSLYRTYISSYNKYLDFVKRFISNECCKDYVQLLHDSSRRDCLPNTGKDIIVSTVGAGNSNSGIYTGDKPIVKLGTERDERKTGITGDQKLEALGTSGSTITTATRLGILFDKAYANSQEAKGCNKDDTAASILGRTNNQLPRGKNYARNQAARERRRNKKKLAQAAVKKVDDVDAMEKVDPLEQELRRTWAERRIYQNKCDIVKSKAFLQNVDQDKQYFMRSYEKYRVQNEMDMARYKYNESKTGSLVKALPLYSKAVEAGFAKTIVSTIKSGVTVSDANSSSISPHDSVSVAERDAEKYRAERRTKLLEQKIKQLEDEALEQQKKSNAVVDQLMSKVNEMEEQKKAAYARSNARRARAGMTGWEYA